MLFPGSISTYEEYSTALQNTVGVMSTDDKGKMAFSNQPKKGLDYDEILEHLGEFGTYQKWLYFLFCMACVFPGVAVLSYSFTGAIPKHRCFVPGYDNATSSYTDPWVESIIPYKEVDGEWQPSRCKMFAKLSESSEETNGSSFPVKRDRNLTVSCDAWVFDDSIFQSTIVTEFQLACDHQWLHPLFGSSYMAGMLVGAFFFGIISDKFGRKPCLVLTIVFLAAGSLGSAFVPDYISFAFCRFITAMGGVGSIATSCVIAMEFVSGRYRGFCGIVIEAFFASGEMLVGFVAWAIRDWRTLQLFLAVPIFPFLSYWWLIPESVRWQIAKGKYQEAEATILKAAKINKKEIPLRLLLGKRDISKTDVTENSEPDVQSTTLIDLFKKPAIRHRTLNMFYNWMAITLGYYGISMNATNLGGDIFVNFTLTAAVEIPSYVFALLTVDRWGRRNLLAFCQILTGVSCVACGFVPKGVVWVQIVLSLVGKFGSSAAFSIVFVYTAELYPTEIRNIAIGSSSTCARLGGIVAPFVAGLGVYEQSLPFLIFGVSSFLAGILVLLLPETLGQKLPETIEDAENLGKDKKRNFCLCL